MSFFEKTYIKRLYYSQLRNIQFFPTDKKKIEKYEEVRK